MIYTRANRSLEVTQTGYQSSRTGRRRRRKSHPLPDGKPQAMVCIGPVYSASTASVCNRTTRALEEVVGVGQGTSVGVGASGDRRWS